MIYEVLLAMKIYFIYFKLFKKAPLLYSKHHVVSLIFVSFIYIIFKWNFKNNSIILTYKWLQLKLHRINKKNNYNYIFISRWNKILILPKIFSKPSFWRNLDRPKFSNLLMFRWKFRFVVVCRQYLYLQS